MAQTLLRGTPVDTVGEIPAVGSTIPEFTLTDSSFGKVHSTEFAGKKYIISVMPSIDTGTCARSTRVFNERATAQHGITVLTVSEDLPPALGRFCGAEGIDNVRTLSAFRSPFGSDFGLTINGGLLDGLLARAVFVVDEHGRVIHSELVDDISHEPDYDKALAVLV